MFKKMLIAAVAVLIGIAAVKHTKVGGYLRVWKNRAAQWAERQVSPETEIARLETEVARLEKEDERNYDLVARQAVEVADREREVAEVRGNLAKTEKFIRDLREAVAAGGDFVSYNGNNYPKADALEQIRLEATTFRTAEAGLKSKEEQLKYLKAELAANKTKLKELEKTRHELSRELTKLKAALAEERQAQKQARAEVCEGAYSRIKEDMAKVRKRVEEMKTKRQLKGESTRGPIRAAEATKDKDAEIDRFISERFGDNGKVTVGR